jgi:hypothetical protein
MRTKLKYIKKIHWNTFKKIGLLNAKNIKVWKYCFYVFFTGVMSKTLHKICMEFWWFLGAKHFLKGDPDVQSQIKKNDHIGNYS